MKLGKLWLHDREEEEARKSQGQLEVLATNLLLYMYLYMQFPGTYVQNENVNAMLGRKLSKTKTKLEVGPSELPGT